MKLPTKFHQHAQACYHGAVNRTLIASCINEAIEYCREHNIPLEADDCPPEIIVMLAQLTYLIGLPDVSLSHRYHEAIKALGFV